MVSKFQIVCKESTFLRIIEVDIVSQFLINVLSLFSLGFMILTYIPICDLLFKYSPY